MSWRIDTHPGGGMMIEHLAAPRFTARWTTGALPVEAIAEGEMFWTDEGSGEEDAIHLYGFVWEEGIPDQKAFEPLAARAAVVIDAWTVRDV